MGRRFHVGNQPALSNRRVVAHPATGCCVAGEKDGVLVEAAAADDPDQTEYSGGLSIAELDHFVDDSVAPAPSPAAPAAVAGCGACSLSRSKFK